MNTPASFAELLAAAPDLSALRNLWLVFDAETAADLDSKQAAHGSPVHRIAPLSGPAGRFALCADLVTEIGPGGLHAALFASLDAAKFAAVAIATREQLDAAGWFTPTPSDL